MDLVPKFVSVVVSRASLPADLVVRTRQFLLLILGKHDRTGVA